jgi:prepilin-type N-terminal cleavage/methylation domain-containing protein
MSISGLRENVSRKRSGAYFLDVPCPGRHGMSGFTLIEIMVVLIICLGLVTLMTTLYQSVGKSAIALRGGQQEWEVQQQMREQILHLLHVPANANNFQANVIVPVAGQSAELYLASWQSGADASSGKPVLGYYHYVAAERVLYYQETPLPAWWQNNNAVLIPAQIQLDARAMPSRKVLTGVDSLEFVYLKKGAADMSREYWESNWHDPLSPALIQLQFNKAGRNYTIWFETRSTDV